MNPGDGACQSAGSRPLLTVTRLSPPRFRIPSRARHSKSGEATTAFIGHIFRTSPVRGQNVRRAAIGLGAGARVSNSTFFVVMTGLFPFIYIGRAIYGKMLAQRWLRDIESLRLLGGDPRECVSQ